MRPVAIATHLVENDRVFDFGIDGYRPQWLCGREAVDSAHGRRLGTLVGRRLSLAWLVWDLDGDEWFADCPVLLDFEGEQLEINHQKFNDLSLTWNTIDAAKPVHWGELALRWRNDVRPELSALCGQAVRAVELLKWQGKEGDLATGSVALHLEVDGGHLTVFNALDENGLSFDPPSRG